MGHGIASVHVRRERGRTTVIGFGQTPRGQKFIRATKTLLAPTIGSKDFKSELAAAVEELLAQQVMPNE